MRRPRPPKVRRPRRHVPQLEDVLERRQLLTVFPLTGTFSGSYSTRAAPGGIGPGQEVSGTITISISVSSIRDLGNNFNQAFIYGNVSATGFLGQDPTYPYSGDVQEQGDGVESGYASSDPESTVEIVVSGFYQNASQNYISITGSCYNSSIIASVNIGLGNYVTPNAAAVTLAGASTAPTPTPTPPPAVPTVASLVKMKKGPGQIVVDFSGPLGGGSGLPLGDFQLTTVAKGKKHVKMIPLASVAYDAAADAVTLTPRHKLRVKTPLKLTISGLGGSPSTLILETH